MTTTTTAPPETPAETIQLDTMTVTVRDRSAESAWGVGITAPVTRKVTISAYCRTCGRRRGEPRGLHQHDDGVWYWVQVWNNPCGHVDRYEDVLAEAMFMAVQPSPDPDATQRVDVPALIAEQDAAAPPTEPGCAPGPQGYAAERWA